MARHELGDMEQIRSSLESWMRRHIPGGASLDLGELSFPEESGESSRQPPSNQLDQSFINICARMH